MSGLRPAGLEPHVSLTEAAALLGVKVHTLHVRLSQGRYPALRAFKVLSRWRVPVAALQALTTPPPAVLPARAEPARPVPAREIRIVYTQPPRGRGRLHGRSA